MGVAVRMHDIFETAIVRQERLHHNFPHRYRRCRSVALYSLMKNAEKVHCLFTFRSDDGNHGMMYWCKTFRGGGRKLLITRVSRGTSKNCSSCVK